MVWLGIKKDLERYLNSIPEETITNIKHSIMFVYFTARKLTKEKYGEVLDNAMQLKTRSLHKALHNHIVVIKELLFWKKVLESLLQRVQLLQKIYIFRCKQTSNSIFQHYAIKG